MDIKGVQWGKVIQMQKSNTTRITGDKNSQYFRLMRSGGLEQRSREAPVTLK